MYANVQYKKVTKTFFTMETHKKVGLNEPILSGKTGWEFTEKNYLRHEKYISPPVKQEVCKVGELAHL